MTTPQENVQLKRLEAELLDGVTDAERASYRWFKGATPVQRREADRRLYARLDRLRQRGCRYLALSKALGVSQARIGRLLCWPPPSEEQVQQYHAERVAVAAQRKAIRQARHREDVQRWKQQRAELRRRPREEKLDTAAWAKNCLIEAFEDMRGHPDLPVVRDV